MSMENKGSRKEEEKSIIKRLSSPDALLFIGALMVVLAYLLYPLRAISMIPGVLIGGGTVGLIWVAFKVLHLGTKK